MYKKCCASIEVMVAEHANVNAHLRVEPIAGVELVSLRAIP
jgi:hypothetical protein